jgi:hypothetical protein
LSASFLSEQRPVGTRELPLERCCALFIATLEGEQSRLDLSKIGEVAGVRTLG